MRRDSQGAAAVEFALVAPIVIVLLLGTIEFGFFFFLQGSAANAAREGARSYAIHLDQPSAADVAETEAESRFYATSGTSTGATATAEVLPNADDPEQCWVTVTYTYDSLTGFFSFLGVTMPPVEGEGVMRCGG